MTRKPKKNRDHFIFTKQQLDHVINEMIRASFMESIGATRDGIYESNAQRVPVTHGDIIDKIIIQTTLKYKAEILDESIKKIK